MSAPVRLPLLLALTAALPATAQIDPVRAAYDTAITGVWQGDGRTCDSPKGSWTFGSCTLRGNATVFDITGVHGTTDRLVWPSRGPIPARRSISCCARPVQTRWPSPAPASPPT